MRDWGTPAAPAPTTPVVVGSPFTLSESVRDAWEFRVAQIERFPKTGGIKRVGLVRAEMSPGDEQECRRLGVCRWVRPDPRELHSSTGWYPEVGWVLVYPGTVAQWRATLLD